MKLHHLTVFLCFGLATQAACTAFDRKSGATADPAAQAATQMHAAKFAHSAEERDQAIAQRTEGYESSGPVLEGELEAFESIDLTLERGRCYVSAVKLGSGATFSEHAKRGLVLQAKAADDGPDMSLGPGVHGPGVIGDLGCQTADRTLTLDLEAIFGGQNPHDLGTGPFTFEVWSKAMTEDEVAALEQQQAEDLAAHEQRKADKAAEDAEKAQTACNRCYDEYLSCIRGGSGVKTCDSKRDSCVYLRASLKSYDDCN